MKNIFVALSIVTMLVSCSREDIDLNKPIPMGLKLEVTQINVENPETFLLETNDFIKMPNWYDYSTKGIRIQRKIVFKSQSPALEVFEIELSFSKNEQIELLILSQEKTFIDTWKQIREWDYKKNELELTKFYNNPNTYVGIAINGLIPSGTGTEFQFDITEMKEIEIDGEVVTWIHAKLSGELYGAYSHSKDKGLKIEGFFEGILE